MSNKLVIVSGAKDLSIEIRSTRWLCVPSGANREVPHFVRDDCAYRVECET